MTHDSYNLCLANEAAKSGEPRRKESSPVKRVANRASVTSRQSYAGIKILPDGAYRKLTVPSNEHGGASETYYLCMFQHPDGEACHR